MRIKKFRGRNALEVLNEVKKTLGEEALILASRRVEEEGEVFYEITAAVDRPPPEELRKERKATGEDLTGLREEVTAIRKMLEDLLSEKLSARRYVRLLEAGIPPELAREIEDPLEWLRKKIAERKETPLSRLQVYVGPPGAGKTTSVFKIAAWLRYRRGASVGVISLDARRIGARAQALRLGELLEIPVLVNEGVEACQDFVENCEYVLFDTPAWGPSFRHEEIRALLEAYPQARVHLVLKAVEHPQNLRGFLEETTTLPVEGLVLTHLDRLRLGLTLGFLLQNGFPEVSFLSTGERVPEDLVRAQPEVLERIFRRGLESLSDLK